MDELASPANERVLPVRIVQQLKVAPLVAYQRAEHGVVHTRDTIGIHSLLVRIHYLNEVCAIVVRIVWQAYEVRVVGEVGELAHRIDGFLGPFLVPLVGLHFLHELNLGHVVPAEHYPGTLDVGGLRRAHQLIPGGQGSDHWLVLSHHRHREIALALLAQLPDGFKSPALLQVREGSHHQLRGLVICFGVGNEVGEVSQDRALGRLGGQGHHLVHGQLLLLLTHLLLPAYVNAGPAVGPQVLGQQLHLPGEVRVHLGVNRPVHQVVRRSRLLDRGHIARDNPEH